MSGIVRSVKNVTKGYSAVQVKVRNATSNEHWGPTGNELNEIAGLTHSSQDFFEIMEILERRLNDKGKNWRHVYKSLVVLDCILHRGNEVIIEWARKNLFVITTLREFQYIDEAGSDVGQGVRTMAKGLTSLIRDEERLRAERRNTSLWKPHGDALGPMPGFAGGDPVSKPPRRSERPAKGGDDEDLEFRLALEASKNEAEEDKKRRESRPGEPPRDEDLERAIKLSQEEEELRRKELEQQNAASLFDDTPTPTQQQTQPTGWNQGYQQQSAVDWFGNPVDQQQQQQPQSTGYLNNAYTQPMAYQNGFQYQQPQQTGFDQMQYQQQQPQYMQPQQTAFNMNNPYSQPTNGFGQPQQQPQQEETPQKPGSQNPWAHLDDQTNIAPQPTGSNNPFASTSNRPQPQSTSAQRAPTLNTLQEQKTATQFNQFNSPSTSFPAQQPPQQQQPQKEMDPHASRLNALLATGDGQDTFGNVGNLRIPAQHTAPGTFVNSAGSGVNRLQPAQTGTNPFMQSQFTGMPSVTHSQMPAQTGPAGGFGASGFGGSSNPFGAQQPPQQAQGQQGGSLIDL